MFYLRHLQDCKQNIGLNKNNSFNFTRSNPSIKYIIIQEKCLFVIPTCRIIVGDNFTLEATRYTTTTSTSATTTNNNGNNNDDSNNSYADDNSNNNDNDNNKMIILLITKTMEISTTNILIVPDVLEEVMNLVDKFLTELTTFSCEVGQNEDVRPI